MSLNVQVRLTSSLRPSASFYVNEFIILSGLSLLAHIQVNIRQSARNLELDLGLFYRWPRLPDPN